MARSRSKSGTQVSRFSFYPLCLPRSHHALLHTESLTLIKEKQNAHAVATNSYESIKDVKFSPDGSKIVSCGVDQTIKVWDAGACNGHTSYPPPIPDTPLSSLAQRVSMKSRRSRMPIPTASCPCSSLLMARPSSLEANLARSKSGTLVSRFSSCHAPSPRL